MGARSARPPAAFESASGPRGTSRSTAPLGWFSQRRTLRDADVAPAAGIRHVVDLNNGAWHRYLHEFVQCCVWSLLETTPVAGAGSHHPVDRNPPGSDSPAPSAD